MSAALLLALWQMFLPIYDRIAAQLRRPDGTMPTTAEIDAFFKANVDKGLATGAEWLAAHPRDGA